LERVLLRVRGPEERKRIPRVRTVSKNFSEYNLYIERKALVYTWKQIGIGKEKENGI